MYNIIILFVCRWPVVCVSNVTSVYGLSVHSWLPDPMLTVSMDCPFILDCPIQCCQCLWIVRSFLIARSNVTSVYGLSVHSWTCSFINTCWQFLLLSWRLIRYNFLSVGDGWKCLLNVNMSTHATLYNHQDIWWNTRKLRRRDDYKLLDYFIQDQYYVARTRTWSLVMFLSSS